MATSFINRFNVAIQKLEQAFLLTFCRRFPPDGLCIASIDIESGSRKCPGFSLKDIIGDGFLWAVPKSRRSIEKRMKRKYGHPDYILKLLQPKNNLRVCNTCGDDHEVGVLCPTCYKKVIEETKAIQETIQENLGLNPVDKEVVVVYDGEKNNKPSEFWEGKRIVEMKKSRPSWFSKNLTQQTTQQPASTSDIKPTQLG